MVTTDLSLLFVYGTLRDGSGHPMGERLAGEADWVGTASVEGALYLISWYPGLTLTPGTGSWVVGDVYRLRDPGESLRWLDEYEGCAGESPEYERIRHPVRLLAESLDLEVWVYRFLGPLERARMIPGGDFLRRDEALP